MEALMAAGNPKLSYFTEGTAASLSLSLKKFEPGRFISESYYSSHSSSLVPAELPPDKHQ